MTEAYSTHENFICSEVNGSYADFNEKFSHLAYEWSLSLSEIVNALRKKGLILEYLNEFTYSFYNCFPNLEEIAADKYVLKHPNKKFPLMFSIKATYQPESKLP
ncbi:hypothetical protein [Fluviispira vulneris]|uniref:hypothetical protein n=1 Tax=Fluviispira vulneris TaxID=2763012 RepID=UPI00164530DF|nr:hypothetical protein [Fluviispira vulneris]